MLILEKKMLTNKVHVLAWRESMEIDIKLYSTTIVNNISAKQAVGKKKKNPKNSSKCDQL